MKRNDQLLTKPWARSQARGTRPRRGIILRLAPVLALTVLALGIMDGTPPAAAQPASNRDTQVLSETQLQA